MFIQHNISSLNTYRHLTSNNQQTAKTLEKLSSGYKINRAGDDAAGLAISEKMRGQIRGLDMAQKNAQDAISLVQTAEGAMEEVHAMLQRGRELSVQAANDTNTESDRLQIQKEIDQINKEIDHISNRTEFNTKKLLNGVATASVDTNTSVTTNKTKVEQFLEDLVSKTLEHSEQMVWDAYGVGPQPGTEILVKFENVQGSGSMAYVTSWTNSATKQVTKQEMVFNIPNMIDNASGDYEADTTVAHEMTHAMMGAAGMNWERSTATQSNLPRWFLEGSAEYVSGGMDRVRAELGQTSGKPNDGTKDMLIQNLLNKIDKGENDTVQGPDYTAGFLATMYLDEFIQRESGNTKTIKDLMQNLVTIPSGQTTPPTLNQGIQNVLGTSHTLDTFITDLKGANGLTFVKNLELSHVGSILDNPPGTLTNQTVVPDTPLAIDTSDFFTYKWDSSTGYLEKIEPQATTSVEDDNDLTFQIGANEGQSISMKLPSISTKTLKLDQIKVDSHTTAAKAITSFDRAIQNVSSERSYLGALQNRLEHTITNLGVASENLTSAESRIRDTDMAHEMMKFTKNNILSQAAQSMLAQANQQPQGILQLLG